MKKQNSKSFQIKQHFLQGIRSRQFTEGLPSENKIAERFKVCRMTARRALNELESEGHVERIQGKGTFVKKREFSQGYFKIQPSWKQAEEINASYSTEVLELRAISEPPPAVADKLQYDQQIILARRLHFFDNIPVRYEIRFLRGDLCDGILWENLNKISIHQLLIEKYDLPLTKVWQRMTAETMSEEIAKILNENAGYPVFHLQRLTFTFKNPVTYVEYYTRGELAFEDTFESGAKNAPDSLNIVY